MNQFRHVDSNSPDLEICDRTTVLLHVNPGVYRLRLNLPDGTARERTLVASPGWTLQCFLMRRLPGFLMRLPVREGAVADLAQGSLSLSKLGKPFSPDDTRIRLSEAALDALANNRKVTDAAANALMNEKFEDPMLGLLVAYLLLRDAPGDPRLRVVFDNLVRLLGEDHPDVRAIAPGPLLEGPTRPLTEMPMFRAGWDRVISLTATKPDLISAASPAGEVAARTLPSTPWLVWEAADTPSTRRNDFKMEMLRNYVTHSAESSRSGVTRAPFPPPSPSLGLTNQMPLSPGLEGGMEGPTSSLASEDREELMRSLGVPSSVLDDMLSRLSR